MGRQDGLVHDLDFDDALRIKSWDELAKRTYRFAGCTRVAQAYTDNLLRVQSMTSIPGFAFMHGEDWGYAINAVSASFPSLKKGSDEFADMAKSTFDANREKYVKQEFYRHYREATGNAENICCQLPSSHQAYHALLQSMVIQAWGAFEVMAEQLWNRVIKQRPSLNKLTAKEKRLSGPRSRTKLANLYRWTFRTDNGAILRVVDSKRVHSLAIVRNVLVHSGGRIDNVFIADRKNAKKDFRPRGKMTPLNCIRGNATGYKILFTGAMVRGLIDPVTPLGFDLVRAVDRWLNTH